MASKIMPKKTGDPKNTGFPHKGLHMLTDGKVPGKGTREIVKRTSDASRHPAVLPPLMSYNES